MDTAEPVLDLVEPGRVGGRVVGRNVRMLGQEVIDRVGLVRADVVADHMDGFVFRTVLSAGVAF